MPDVVFYNRDFSNTEIPLDLEGVIERYAHAMIGGPKAFTLKVEATADKWSLLNLLRCPVEVIGDDGGKKWWGLVNRVGIPQGKNRVGLGLDNMFNSIAIQYDGGITTTAIDVYSKNEFGEKQRFIDYSSLNRAAAELRRDSYLLQHRIPKDDDDLSGDEQNIVIESLGWIETLGWLYYNNASTTLVDNALQVRDIALACGQFFRGVIVENLSGITSVPKRDGRDTGLTYINQLLNAGSADGQRMLARVDKNRVFHIYKQPAETIECLINEDGDFETLLEEPIEPQNCPNAIWAKLKGVPNTVNRGMTSLGMRFIDSSEYIEFEKTAQAGQNGN